MPEEEEEVSGGRKRAVREEFETLSTGAGERGGTGGRAGLWETESVPAYNLKTHSAFKLLTMAAGYKVLCRCRGEGGCAWGRAREGWARFKSLIYLRGDCGRHDSATAGRSGGRFWMGRTRKKIKGKRRGVFRCRHLGHPACEILLSSETLGVPCHFTSLPFPCRSFATVSPRFDRK